MNLQDATRIATEVTDALRPFCHRIEVAGSVRRLKSVNIHDVEVVAIPNSIYAAEIRTITGKKWGPPIAGEFPSYYTKIRALYNLDLFWMTPEKWGLGYFIRTGPAEFSERALGFWKKVTNGGYSEACQLHLPDGTIVPTPEEEDVFRVLEHYSGQRVPFTPPEKRFADKIRRNSYAANASR